MAADFIVTNRTKQHGNNYVRAASLLLELRNLVSAEFESGNHMVDGSDRTMLEAQFGWGAGVGANALTLLGLIRGILLTDDEITGANRKAWLDEFCARVANQ